MPKICSETTMRCNPILEELKKNLLPLTIILMERARPGNIQKENVPFLHESMIRSIKTFSPEYKGPFESLNSCTIFPLEHSRTENLQSLGYLIEL